MVPADLGSTIRVRVTGTNGGGATTADSAPTAVVTADPPANTSLPTISGTARDTQTLTAANGTWTGTLPLVFTRQWRRCNGTCQDIAGATGATYALTGADVGSTIVLRITATNGSGSASADSAATGVVGADPPANTAPPTLSGTARDTQLLTATTGTWTGTATVIFTTQWLRCDASGAACSTIAGATGGTYAATSSDVGGTIRARVTGTNAGGSSFADSAPSAVVAPDPPASTGVPGVSGTARDGQTLSSSQGSWSGTAPLAFSRQWLRCDGSGAACVVISGATGTTYDVVATDVGSTLRVRVTASNGGGSASADSAPTALASANPPANAAAPTVTGTARDGQTLTLATGTWSGTAPILFSRQWERCNGVCQDIANATGATYALTPADVGSTIVARVTASNGGGSASAESAPTSTVVADPPSSASAPSISGTPRDGQTLTASSGTWNGTPKSRSARNGCAATRQPPARVSPAPRGRPIP